MFGLGAGELFLIFIIALLFLGPKKLPELAKGLGQAMREFQKARDDMMNEVNKPHPETKTDSKIDPKKDIEVAATPVEEKTESPKHS